MAKYNWKQLEKEYILGDYKSVSDFLKNKEIPNNSRNRSNTKGWKDKKCQKSDKVVAKTIEKVIEKESEKESKQIVDIKTLANDLALNVIKANTEINNYIVKSKGKTKKVKYDLSTSKPKEETINENEGIEVVEGIVDKKGLKQLTSALKDLNDILVPKDGKNNDKNNYEEYLKKVEGDEY